MAEPNLRAAEQLARDMKSWKSIELRSHEELVNDVAASDPNMFASLKEYNHYIETASGGRFFEQRMLPPHGKEIKSTYYYDGKRSADFTPRRDGDEFEHVLIKHDFGIEAQTGSHWCPEPLFYYYFGFRPLHEALATAESLGVDTHIGRDCEVFLIRGMKSNPVGCLVYSLDRAKSIPLKARYYANEADRLADRPISAWNALALEEVEGHLLPMRSEQFYYATDGSNKPVVRRTIVVDEVHFNRDYPATTFWPKITDETQVNDALRKTVTNPKSLRTAPTRPFAASSVGTPVRAVETEGWGSMIPGAALVLGAALLITGGVLWWRRRAAR